MQKNKKIFSLVLLAFCLFSGSAFAAAEENYQYTVTLYYGQKYTDKAETFETETASKGTTVDLSGYVNAARTALENSNSKYYVKGIRLSGRDNAQKLSSTSVTANADEMYCVAYGVRGDSTYYYIYYTDQNGNLLQRTPDKIYGNVGDKPVVACKYFDGYTPRDAYNQTKTLVKDETQNVFTFTYSPIPQAQTTVTTVVTGNNQNAGNQNAQNNANVQNAENAQNNENEEAAEAAPIADNAEAEQPAAPAVPVIPPAPIPAPQEEVVIEEPPTPVDMLDLDPTGQETFSIADVAVPLATLQGRADLGDRSARVALVLRRIVFPLLLAVLVAGIILLVILKKRKHRLSLEELRYRDAYSAAPASGPSRAQAYRPAWKDDPNFSDDYDRKDL